MKAYNIVCNWSLCCRMGMFINQNFIYLSCHSMTFIRDLPHWFLQSSHIIGHPMYLNKIDPSIDIYIHPHSSNKFHRVELVLDIMLLSYLFAWHLFIKCSHIHWWTLLIEIFHEEIHHNNIHIHHPVYSVPNWFHNIHPLTFNSCNLITFKH